MGHKYSQLLHVLRHKFKFVTPAGHGDDHKWVELRLTGVPPIRTKVSHGAGEASKEIEAMIARQLRVSNAFFRGMIDCTNSCEDYYRQLETDPRPPFRPGS
jgi:hypothetical protein